MQIFFWFPFRDTFAFTDFWLHRQLLQPFGLTFVFLSAVDICFGLKLQELDHTFHEELQFIVIGKVY